MKYLIPILVLCAAYNIKSMEISYMTTKNAERTPLLKDTGYCYNPKNALKEKSLIDQFAQLPKEIGLKIIHKLLLFETKMPNNFEKDQNNPHHMVIFGLRLRAKEKSPLTIGNKTLDWIYLIQLDKNQQNELYSLANPGVFYSYITGFDNSVFPKLIFSKQQGLVLDEEGKNHAIKTLQKQPSLIKEGLTIRTASCFFEHLVL